MVSGQSLRDKIWERVLRDGFLLLYFHNYLIVFLAKTTKNDAISSHPESRSMKLKSLQEPVKLPICVVVVSITKLRSKAPIIEGA